MADRTPVLPPALEVNMLAEDIRTPPSPTPGEPRIGEEKELADGPKPEAPAWVFENITALSHTAKTIHVIYVGFLVYCALTIITTSDRQIILDEGARLPLLGIDVKFSVFLITAPLVAIFMFLYFQLHVQILRRRTLEINRDYRTPSQERLYPWMIDLAQQPESGMLGYVQQFIVRISLWWLLPIVLFRFTLFSLKMGDARISCGELLIFSTGLALVFWLYDRYRKLLGPAQGGENHQNVSAVAILVGKLPKTKILGGVAVITVASIGYQIYLTRSQQSLELSGQVLKGAHLSNAQLRSANLEFINLEEANLFKANLSNAKLPSSNLKNTKILQSNLSGANLNCADLSGSNLEGSDLTGAFLSRVNLSGTTVSPDQLIKAKTLFEATFDPVMTEQIKQYPQLNSLVNTPPPTEDSKTASYAGRPDHLAVENCKQSTDSGRHGNDRICRTKGIEGELWEARYLLRDETFLVNEKTGHSLAEVRFLQTMATDATFYLRKVRGPSIMVPCSRPPITKSVKP